MMLYINATNLHSLTLALISQTSAKQQTLSIKYHDNHLILSLLLKFLRLHDARISDLSAICVATGPGSFTGIRVSLALAQGLGLSQKLPLYTLPNQKIPTEIQKLYTLVSKKPTKLSVNYGRPAV